MKIHLGLHLDGQHCRRPTNLLGEITVGPLGLLGILETQLGLLRASVSPSERVVQYQHCLTQCDTPTRFYHRSFEADALGTAATLLAWRDAWYLHGWDGAFQLPASARLQDMGEVEDRAKNQVAPSIGERLAAVLLTMQHCHPVIDEILLIDPLEAFPQRWREVLQQLPTRLTAEASPHPVGQGFLSELQAALLAVQNGQAPQKLSWKADGTVTVAQAETRLLAGQWLSALTDREDNKTGLIVASTEGELLDGMLVTADQPRQGFCELSAFRPSLQVLPLALEILWDPLNFYSLLQFLTHPICPVPAVARAKLADKLAEQPGIGGKAWFTVLDEIDEYYGATDSEQAKAVREKVRFWVEHPRHTPETGAPLDSILERVDRLQDYFRLRMADQTAAARIAFSAGFAQCQAFGKAVRELQQQGIGTLRPTQLQQLVTQATANGSANPLLAAEVGAQLGITHPAAAIEPCDWVLWWQLAMPHLPADYPWSRAELHELTQQGVGLPSVADMHERAAQEWLRPILCAREELVLVLPPKGEELHPLWLMIEALFDQVPIRSLEVLLTEPAGEMKPVTHKALPARQRWWSLPADIPAIQTSKASFSSLELFLFNPYHWLLKYPARLTSSRILSMSDDFRLFGNLAHELVERFYRQPNALGVSDSTFDAWFDENFEQVIAEQGAVLLMPGRRADLEGFRFRLREAVRELRRQIAKAGFVQVQPEQPLNGHFAGGELLGYADLVLEKANGERAIVDMKWAGIKKYSHKLKDNRHLQLALYAEMLRQQHEAWPSVAYYIFDRAQLLATDTFCFPAAQLVRNTSDENLPQLWQRFIKTWQWRKEQLDQGQVELVLEDIPATDESTTLNDALAIETLKPDYNDYLALAGWEK